MAALEIFNFLHFIGLAFGLGGATIATIIAIKASKDGDVEKAAEKLMPSIAKLIWVGLILLIISGIALPFYISWPLDKTMLFIKHILVFWIVVFGVIIGIMAKKKKKTGMKIFSTINLILWYAVTLMSAFV